jgi:hypothetical protein
VDGPVEVTLHRPAPLDRPLIVNNLPEQLVTLCDGDLLLAEARPAVLDLSVVPVPPTYAEAVTSSLRFVGANGQHPFPTCFVCGPWRAGGDGMRLFPGPLGESELVAAPWTPNESLAGSGGYIRPEIMWAALDCPGGIAAFGREPRPLLLGKMTGTILQPIRPGEQAIATGWVVARNGRKYHTGTALFSPSGTLQAYARSVWIEPKRLDHTHLLYDAKKPASISLHI